MMWSIIKDRYNFALSDVKLTVNVFSVVYFVGNDIIIVGTFSGL